MTAIDRRRFLIGASGFGSAIWLGATSGPARAAAAISATYGPSSAIYCLNMAALELGYARDEGIDLKLVPTDGGAKARQVLAAGQADFAHGDASHPLQIANRGKPAKMLLCTENTASYANMMVRSDLYEQGITTPEKLANWKRPNGAKPIVAATAIGSGTWMFGTYIFERLDLGPRVNWVAGGGPTTTLGGLQSKQFDAAMVLPSWQFEAEAKGWAKLIFDVGDRKEWDRYFGGTLPVATIYGLDTTIAKSAEITQAYVNAAYRTLRWLKDSSVDEIYAKVGEKYLGDLDPASTKRELAFYKKSWNYDGGISKAEFDNGGKVWFREGTDIKDTTYETAVDMRFLEAARKKHG